MDPEEKTLRQARDASSGQLKKLANVDKIGIGFKEVGGKLTNEPCLRVYVSKKVPASQLDPKDIVPRQIAGAATDVNPTPQERLASDSPVTTPYTIQERPVPCGAQIAISGPAGVRQWVGTAGCFVRKSGIDADYLLSCAHVLNPKYKDAGADPLTDSNGIYVHQPAAWDTADGRGIAFTGSNPRLALGDKVDAGTARMWDGIKPSNYVWKLGQLDATPSGIGQATWSEANVAKYGRSTGRTHGRVIDFSYTTSPAYAKGTIPLAEQYYVHGESGAFCAEGDSGAPLVIPYPNGHAKIIGIIVAMDQYGNAFASRIENVFAALNIERLCGLNPPAP